MIRVVIDTNVRRPQQKKKKPMTVAAVPMIGNYQLPPMDFLQHPDMTVKPTESKEELMANARLMQQTLAQFEDEVNIALYPEGKFLFLDGGTLDLGVVRDGTMVAANEYSTFVETFEAVATVAGAEALWITATGLEVSGAAADLVTLASVTS